jgi:zinc-ribbon domain
MSSVCGRCGKETSPTARFCRQCGAPLFVESDAAKAATRQYAPQNPPYPQYQAAPPIDANPPEYLKHDTARLYEPPSAGRNTATVPPRPKSSKAAIWFVMIFLVLMCFAAVGGLVVPRIIRRAINNHFNDQPVVSVPIPPAIPAPPMPPPPPPPPGAVPGKISSLDQLVYPGATIVNRIRVMGQEVLQMRSSDDIDAIKAFYTQRLGAAIVENEEHKAVFMLMAGAGKTLVTIEPDDENHSDQVSIKAVRSNLPIQIPQSK